MKIRYAPYEIYGWWRTTCGNLHREVGPAVVSRISGTFWMVGYSNLGWWVYEG